MSEHIKCISKLNFQYLYSKFIAIYQSKKIYCNKYPTLNTLYC